MTPYRSRKAKNTIIRQNNDLRLFTDYLTEVGATISERLSTYPEDWTGISWGLVEGFISWQLQQGFAVSSVNVRLSTVKAYAKLAVKAGILNKTEYAMICTVTGYSQKEARRIDEARTQADLPTRFEHAGARSANRSQLSESRPSG